MSHSRVKESPEAQARISSFFTQSPKKTGRGRTPIDLTQDSDEEPQAKRRKTTSTFFTPGASTSKVAQTTPQHTQEPVVSSRYRYDPSGPTKHPIADHPRAKDPVRRQRKERLRKILLGDDNVFSQGQQEDEEVAEDDDVEEDGDQQENNEATAKFKSLMQDYTSPEPSSKRTSAKRKAAQPKPREEIGPSGQTYTLLELQVSNTTLSISMLLRIYRSANSRRTIRVLFFCLKSDTSALSLVKMHKLVLRDLIIMTTQPHHSLLDRFKAAEHRLLPQAKLPYCNDTCSSKGGASKEVSRPLQLPMTSSHLSTFRLLSQGLKVGIVEQVETAALKKVSKNKGGVFARELTHLYTAAT